VKLTRSFRSLDELPDLLDFAAESAKSAGFSETLAFKAQVVLEELFVNIFKHAYQGGEGRAEVALETTGDGMFLRFEDWGPPFDPLAAAPPDLQKRFELGIPGGAGLVLVRSMSENSRYARREGRNILELRLSV
jgi:sigma-B regulation protein RsbU (phosphoserine phosphatase)